SGIPNFCAVALALNQLGYRAIGVRLDSGDLAKQSVEIRHLVEVNGSPRLKVTEDPEKTTLPGRKVVYRLWDEAGFPCMDLMALEEESAPEAGQEVEYWSLGGTEKAGKVIPSAVEILHLVYFKDG
ncbi:Nicotinate phosphoribosyltransferase, partial [Ophiophagus hannah]